MAITQEERQNRQKHIGSSDVPAILGLDPWRDPIDIWASKVFPLDKEKPTAWQETGNYLEPALVDWCEARIEEPITRDVGITAPNGIIRVNLDGLTATNKNIEAKTCGIDSTFAPELSHFGEDGTDQVPKRVIIQTQVQMYAAESEFTFVPALLGGRGWNLYHVERNEGIVDKILETVVEWWLAYVETKKMPPGMPKLEVLEKLDRIEGKVVDVDSDLMQSWRDAAGLKSKWTKEEKETKTALLATLGDAELGRCPLGEVTYKFQEGGGFEVPRWRKRVPHFRKAKPAKQQKQKGK